MISFLVAILLVVLKDAFCASLPIHKPAADLGSEGKKLDVGVRDTERQRIEALKEKLINWKDSYVKDEIDAKTLRDINKENAARANEERPILSSDFEGGRARALEKWEDMNEEKVESYAGKRQNREALSRHPIDKRIMKRRWSKNGKVRVQLTDHNGQPSFRKRRFNKLNNLTYY